jgi:hypothetical protein
MKILKAALFYFALVFAAGFALGSIRVPLLVPRYGVRVSELLEMPIMFVVIVFAARHVTRRFSVQEISTAAGAGAIAFVLLVAAELLLAFAFQGMGVGDYIASRDPVSGTVYFAMLALYALMPSLFAGRAGTISRR